MYKQRFYKIITCQSQHICQIFSFSTIIEINIRKKNREIVNNDLYKLYNVLKLELYRKIDT